MKGTAAETESKGANVSQNQIPETYIIIVRVVYIDVCSHEPWQPREITER